MQQLEHILERIGITAGQAIILAGGLAFLLVLAVWVRRLGRGRRPTTRPVLDLGIRVDQLDQQGPPDAGPTLELYHLPMRLAALVIAPTGRGGDPIDEDRLPAIADQLVPGMGAVIEAQRPVVYPWPAQLSSQGFANTFFTQARLPGDKGKATPWCALAGRFEADGQKWLIGMILRGAAANNVSQIVVERDSQWLDSVRVRLTRSS